MIGSKDSPVFHRASLHLKGLALVLGAWLAFALLAVVYFGAVPRTITGWILLILVGPLLVILGEGIAEGLLAWAGRRTTWDNIRRWIDFRTAGKAFSWLRVGVLLAAALSLLAMLAVFFWVVQMLANAWPVLGDALNWMNGLFERHFAP